eukprot:5051710-Alexandrium_andersonii.AAC.1
MPEHATANKRTQTHARLHACERTHARFLLRPGEPRRPPESANGPQKRRGNSSSSSNGAAR